VVTRSKRERWKTREVADGAPVDRRSPPAKPLNRERIYAIASKVYERGRKGSYDLLPEDF